MSNLVLTFSELYLRVSNFLGLTAPEVAPTDTNLTVCKAIVYRAYRQFLYPTNLVTGAAHEWSFLKQLYVFNTEGSKYKYPLPDNFSDVLEPPYFGDSGGYSELTRVGPEQILKLRSATLSSGFPLYFAIVPFSYENEVGTYYEMWIDPVPDAAYQLKMFYRIDPLKPTNSTDYVVGGIRASEAILENCLAVAEQQENNEIGIHTRLAAELTQKLIQTDIQDESDCLGNMSLSRPSMYRWYSAVGDDPTINIYASDR